MTPKQKMTEEERELWIEAKLIDSDFLGFLNGYFEGILNKDNARDLVVRYLDETEDNLK